MKDREFIELLNLYVDREISAEDAMRLESEVVADPKRREVYDQYCRMQKACTMLSQEQVEAYAPAIERNVVNFPASPSWSFGPAALGLAAAVACAAGIISFKVHKANVAEANAQFAANMASAAHAVSQGSDAQAMKPVFVVSRLPMDTAVATTQFGKVDQLDWIGNVQMAPVFTASSQEFLTPKTDIKASAIADPQSDRDGQEPAEMTAFRFQR